MLAPLPDTEKLNQSALSLRWIAVGVFISSSTLNFLDRQLLATLAPLIMAQLHFNQTGYGFVLSAFSIAYAASSVLVGWLLDRVGVNRGISAAVAWWSAAAASMGLVGTFSGLVASRVALGAGESAGVPAVGKLNGRYLKPDERALGAALNQVGISLGLALSPLWIGAAYRYSWRLPFVIVGVLGFLWLPLWKVVSRLIPPTFSDAPDHQLEQDSAGFKLLLHRKLIVLIIVNVLWMGAYSLWSNWTTLYLTRVHGLTLKQSASYVWIPPLVSNFGGFFGGWLSQRAMRRGMESVQARCRAVQWSAAGMLITLLLPLAVNAGWATVIISASFFFALAGSVNIYAIPIDLYGAARSGLAISALVFAYGILQTFISPLIGYLADQHLYRSVVWMVTLSPVLGAILLNQMKSKTKTSR